MSRTITAMFDSRAEAEAARTRLGASSIDADNVRIIDKNETGSSGTSGSEEGGFWSSVKAAFMPEEDSHAYEEGMRRGGYLLCAQVDENRADEAVRILDEAGSIDFDRRQEEWRGDGWPGFAGTSNSGAAFGTGMRPVSHDARDETRDAIEEQRIPLVEEELRVGKREVARGGARVRSYVQERPVHEQVNLREEHVSIERRPVDQPLGSTDLNRGDMFQDRTIEMTETAEEAVVAKEAHVREELVVRKTAEEHVQTIDDTVRRTEVDVDEGLTNREDRSAFGFQGGSGHTAGATAETQRSDYERTNKDRF